MSDKPYANLLKRHLAASTKMLMNIVESCPDDVWIEPSSGSPI